MKHKYFKVRHVIIALADESLAKASHFVMKFSLLLVCNLCFFSSPAYAQAIDKDVSQFCKMDKHLDRSNLSNYKYTKTGIVPDKSIYTKAYFQTQELKQLFKDYKYSKRAGGRSLLESQIKSMESRLVNLKGINKRVIKGEIKRLKRRIKKLDKSPNSPARLHKKIAPKIKERQNTINLLTSTYSNVLNELPNELMTIGYFESAISWAKLTSDCLAAHPPSDIPVFSDKTYFFKTKNSHKEIDEAVKLNVKEIMLRNINAPQSPFFQQIKVMQYSEQRPLFDRLRSLVGPSSLNSSALAPTISDGFRADLANTFALLNEKYYQLGFFQVAKAPWNNRTRPFLSGGQLALTVKLEQEQIRLANRAVSLSPEICTTQENVVRLRSHHYAPLHIGSSTFCVPQIEVGMNILKDEFRSVSIDRSAIEESCSEKLKSEFCQCLAKKADGHFSQVEYNALIDDPLAFIRYISIIDGMDSSEQLKGYYQAFSSLVEGEANALGDLVTTVALSAPNHAETLARSCR